MKILLLNQVFWPDVAATAQYGYDLAKYLSGRARHQVTVVASRSLYGGIGANLSREDWIDGIRIVRSGKSVFGKRGLIPRALDFGVFHVAALVRALLLPRQSVIVCFTTPPFILLIGIILRRIKRTRVICWSMDLYPEVPLAAGVVRRGSLMHRAFESIDRFCLRRADRVIVLGRCMRERMLAKGVKPERIELVDMWADPGEFSGRQGVGNAFRSAWGIGDRFTIQYSGNFGIGHDGRTIYEAMRLLRGEDRIRWVFAGGGTKRAEIEEFVRQERIDNVVLKSYQPRESLGELIALGDVHLVTISQGFEGLMVPSKFYGALAAGRPVIYIGPASSEVARVIAEEGCGIVIDQQRPQDLCAAIRRLMDEPGYRAEISSRALAAAHRRFTLDRSCDRWNTIIQSVRGHPADQARAVAGPGGERP
jgi:colanic acid biosynthesis glycosyl transferase WcaI